MSDVLGLRGGANGGHGGAAEQAGDALFCYFHPREFLVGVCAHCLRDRLLLLLAASSKHGGGHRAWSPADGASYLSARPYCSRAVRRRTGSSISLPKVFALGSSFLHRQLDYNSSSRHHTAVDDDDDKKNGAGAGAEEDASVASLDDSFISIKFEDNGKATWDSCQKVAAAGAGAGDDDGAKPKTSTTDGKAAAATKTTTAVVEHVKRGGVTRWRKLLQLARWKRSTAAAAPEQRSKGRGGGGRSWIRSLTRRRAAHGDRTWS